MRVSSKAVCFMEIIPEIDEQTPDRNLTLPSPQLISQEEKETLCRSCLAARSSPNWQARLALAKSALHCARCKAHHPRCLFSKPQRNSNIPHSIRYCIGHEGLVRLCEHKAVSWRQILALSNSIMRQKVGRKYRVVRCLHDDHADLDLDVTERRPYSKLKRLGLGVGTLSRTTAGYPTLTVGFKDNRKEFSLILSWEGHISLDVGDKSALMRRGPEAELELQQKLEERLGKVRERQGKFIFPEPEPGRRLEEAIFESPTKDQHDSRESGEGKEEGGVRVTGSKGPSMSSTPLMMCRESAGVYENTEPLLTRAHNPSLIKNGKISGSARIKWRWGIGDQLANDRTDSAIELDSAEIIANTTAGDNKPLTEDKKHMNTHSRECRPKDKPEKTPRKEITDTLKVKRCRQLDCIWNHCTARKISILKRLKELFRNDHAAGQDLGFHATGKTVCLRVKYERRLVVGDDLHGADVRDIVGFQNWMAVLDPDSYKLGRDDEGEGVYWCRGVDEVTMDRGVTMRMIIGTGTGMVMMIMKEVTFKAWGWVIKEDLETQGMWTPTWSWLRRTDNVGITIAISSRGSQAWT